MNDCPSDEPSLPAGKAAPRAKGLLRHNLRANSGDGATCSMMVATGEMCFVPFALALRLGEVAVGQLATWPVLAGAVLQLVAPWGVAVLKSNRLWVTLSSAVQGLSLLAAASAIWAGDSAGTVLFAATIVYWGAGLAASPSWNTWMEDLVPRRIRAKYFAARTRLCQAFLLVSLIATSVVLHWGEHASAPTLYFAALFLVAAAARAVSVYFLFSQSETLAAKPVSVPNMSQIGLRRSVRLMMRGNTGRLLAYLFSIQFVVHISGPYFTPYTRAELKFEFWQLTAITAAAYLGRILSVPWLGKLAHERGPLRLLKFSGWGIVPLAALWLVSDNFYYISFLQFVCGVAWGGYELAMFLLFFETIPKTERTGVLTCYHLGNSLAMVAGGMVGGWVLTHFGHDKSVYHALFVVSSSLRIVCLLLLARVQKPELSRPTSIREERAAEAMAGMPSASTLEDAGLPAMTDDTILRPKKK